jgi:hypothetical protein
VVYDFRLCIGRSNVIAARLAVITLGRLMIETLRIADSDNPRLPHIVAAVLRRSCGVNGARPSSAHGPGVLTLPLLCLVPFNAPDIGLPSQRGVSPETADAGGGVENRGYLTGATPHGSD